MMYRIKTELSEQCVMRGVIEYKGKPVMTIPATASTASTASTVINCKDSEEVQKAIPHLLDEISEGKLTSIKITEL